MTLAQHDISSLAYHEKNQLTNKPPMASIRVLWKVSTISKIDHYSTIESTHTLLLKSVWFCVERVRVVIIYNRVNMASKKYKHRHLNMYQYISVVMLYRIQSRLVDIWDVYYESIIPRYNIYVRGPGCCRGTSSHRRVQSYTSRWHIVHNITSPFF